MKTSSRHVLNTSSRRLQDQQMFAGIVKGDSWNYMLPILVVSNVKRMATQILVITKLNSRKKFTLRGFLSKHLLNLKTSWRRHQNVFSETIFCLTRRLKDVPSRHLQDFFKAFSRHVFKTSSIHLEDVYSTSWSLETNKMFIGLMFSVCLYLKNLNLYLINLYFTYL